MSPSPSTSSTAALDDAASVPVTPKRTVVASTVVASKVAVVRMATGVTPRLLGLMLFGKLAGLMSIETAGVKTRPVGPFRPPLPAGTSARQDGYGPAEAARDGEAMTSDTA